MRMEKLKQSALYFLASDWSKQAIDLGWTEIELFGLIYPERYDGWGLVTAIGLSSFGCTITGIELDQAQMVTRAGRHYDHEKQPPGLQMARVFWELE